MNFRLFRHFCLLLLNLKYKTTGGRGGRKDIGCRMQYHKSLLCFQPKELLNYKYRGESPRYISIHLSLWAPKHPAWCLPATQSTGGNGIDMRYRCNPSCWCTSIQIRLCWLFPEEEGEADDEDHNHSWKKCFCLREPVF